MNFNIFYKDKIEDWYWKFLDQNTFSFKVLFHATFENKDFSSLGLSKLGSISFTREIGSILQSLNNEI